MSESCLRPHRGPPWANSAMGGEEVEPPEVTLQGLHLQNPGLKLFSADSSPHGPCGHSGLSDMGLLLMGPGGTIGLWCRIFACADLSFQNLPAPSAHLVVLGSWRSPFHTSLIALPDWPGSYPISSPVLSTAHSVMVEVNNGCHSLILFIPQIRKLERFTQY